MIGRQADQTAATGLVPGKLSPLKQTDGGAGPGRRTGGAGSRRTGTDHYHVEHLAWSTRPIRNIDWHINVA